MEKKVYLREFWSRELDPTKGYYVSEYYYTESQYKKLISNLKENGSYVSDFQLSTHNIVNAAIL